MSDLNKPSRNEEDYFATRDWELIEQQRKARAESERASERKQHYMKCPKCGADLTTVDYEGIQIDKCPECLGVWLDAGELEVLHRVGSTGLIGSVIRDMRHVLGAKRKGGA